MIMHVFSPDVLISDTVSFMFWFNWIWIDSLHRTSKHKTHHYQTSYTWNGIKTLNNLTDRYKQGETSLIWRQSIWTYGALNNKLKQLTNNATVHSAPIEPETNTGNAGKIYRHYA